MTLALPTTKETWIISKAEAIENCKQFFKGSLNFLKESIKSWVEQLKTKTVNTVEATQVAIMDVANELGAKAERVKMKVAGPVAIILLCMSLSNDANAQFGPIDGFNMNGGIGVTQNGKFSVNTMMRGSYVFLDNALEIGKNQFWETQLGYGYLRWWLNLDVDALPRWDLEMATFLWAASAYSCKWSYDLWHSKFWGTIWTMVEWTPDMTWLYFKYNLDVFGKNWWWVVLGHNIEIGGNFKF